MDSAHALLPIFGIFHCRAACHVTRSFTVVRVVALTPRRGYSWHVARL